MPPTLTEVLLYTAAAGLAIPVGGYLAWHEHIQPKWLERELRHGIIAFGGGVLLAAVALVLVPEGVKHLSTAAMAVSFFAGGLAAFLLDWWMARRRIAASNLWATVLDYMPEALALGAMFSVKAAAAPLLALLIGLQNLPEGFNAFREMRYAGRMGAGRILLLMLLLVPVGPLLVVVGRQFLSGHEPALGVIMLGAAGGILYLTFGDIAPQAKLRRHWVPPLGAVAGFLMGLVGERLIGG